MGSTQQIVNPATKERFDKHGRVKIHLSHIQSKNLFNVSTAAGQEMWKLTPAESAKAKTAVSDATETREVLIRAAIPLESIERI